ncbi:putative C6 transcription factor [Aspergillus mulundensis]|uniref:Putative Zn(II)2Cys6 transcription factor n=1 Tax=Aspergillus mulundensis TaxID=1810919 RepID=A0A3D8SL54_9EURO|nr:putative Zn(II)2Cys6 transcription factor [Aspergillus mulundensis]RDW87040.1 putative Zn(II)2Cys6 transcription factor [Aspergillus mulundensis]
MATARTGPRKLKRTSNACIACRTSKIKCTGEHPCANCQRRRVDCRFLETVSKVMVSERYLRELELQKRATAGERQRQPLQQTSPSQSHSLQDQPTRTSVKRTSTSAFGDEVEVDIDGILGSTGNTCSASTLTSPPEIPLAVDSERTIWTSPFTLPSRIIKKNHKSKRNWTWLAPTSAWSFTARLKLMIAEKLHVESHYSSAELFDGDLYPIQWSPLPVGSVPDISNLPSLDHALYFFNTVKFHLGHNFRLIHEGEFIEHMHAFYYEDAIKQVKECRLWFVQFLLVLAFGNAFLFPGQKGSSSSSTDNDPPGSKFFIRAMSLMPDHTSLSRGGFVAIEVLALTGLYLYSIDHRSSAHVYVGHAIRIAQMDGMHTQLPEDELGSETVARCRNLWWTLYVLDRHISSSVGASMTQEDSDITTLLDPPTAIACSQNDTTLSLSVRLSHLLSYILSSIYKGTETQLGTFLETTRSILHVLAGHAREIERIIQLKFQNSVDTMPKGTRHITLLYHQCVIVATRPLLLSVLKERLQKLDHGAEDWQSIVAPTNALISAGIKSAAKTLQILTDEDSLLGIVPTANPSSHTRSNLDSHGCIEVFLPFHMEFTYAAALHVTMAGALFPNVTESQEYIQIGDAYAILDQMVSRGNKLAGARKTELVQLETLFRELSARIERRGLETLILPCPAPSEYGGVTAAEYFARMEGAEETGVNVDLADGAGDGINMAIPESPSVLAAQAANMDILDSIGISSYEFFSLVNQIAPGSLGVLDGGEQEWEGTM